MLERFAEQIDERTKSDEYVKWVNDLLLEMISIDNTPKADVDLMRRNEVAIFKIIEREIMGRCGYLKPEVHRAPIDVGLISRHPYFTPPHYTKTAYRPEGLSSEEAYADRNNMVVILNGSNGRPASPTICAHVDTVAPHIQKARAEAGIVYGRGACDDKGSVVSAIGAMRAISEICEGGGEIPFRRGIILHFVIDEEPGGNGALSLALNDDWTSDNVLVSEITDLVPHRANRGALWYKADLAGKDIGFDTLMAIAHVVLSLEAEGDKIFEETAEGIFLKEHVQTSHGIIGAPASGGTNEVTFGQHPSTVNGYVKLALVSDAGLEGLRGAIENAIGKYVAKYGDKSLEKDPDTGSPKVPRHFSIVKRGGDSNVYDIEVLGKTGHMGAIRQCDCAIIKLAYILVGLSGLADEGRVRISAFLAGAEETPSRELILEGGQGFTASHNLAEIQSRITSAVGRGVNDYLSKAGLSNSSAKVRTSFDKLHNDAYESPEGSEAWQAILDACDLAGIGLSGQERLAWRVSCDARLYAKAPLILDSHKGVRNVITFGAGSLKYAHSEAEQMSISDLLRASSAMALWSMKLSTAH